MLSHFHSIAARARHRHLRFRLKFNKLKFGSEAVPSDDPKSSSNEGQISKTSFDDGNYHLLPLHANLQPFLSLSDENKDDSHLTFGGSSVSFKQGRQLLRQYVLTLLRVAGVGHARHLDT